MNRRVAPDENAAGRRSLGPLFAAPIGPRPEAATSAPERTHARANDPIESREAAHAAAAEGRIAQHCRELLALVRAHPRLTTGHYAALPDCPLDEHECTRRMSDLLAAGRVRVAGRGLNPTGRAARIYEALE